MAKPIRHRGKWRIRPVGPDGQMESYVFDSFDDAQIALIERQLAVRKIRLGRLAPETVDWTFDDLVEVWLCHRASQKRSGKDDEAIDASISCQAQIKLL